MGVRKVIVAGALGVAAFGGGVVGAVGLSPITATAQDAIVEAQKPAGWFGSVLSDLVGEGEISQAQADLIETRVEEARLERSRITDHPTDRRGANMGSGLKGAVSGLAEALNSTPQELFAAVRDGQTIAEIADEQGVSTDDLIEILTAEQFAAIDEKVANGMLDAEDADAYKAKATEGIQAFIDGEADADSFGKRGHSHGHSHGRQGHWKSERFGADADSEETNDA